MGFSLSRSASVAGFRLAAFDTVGSTNEEALLRARAGEGGPLWLVSCEQTAGRGRRGTAWQTVRGNLAASLLVASDLPPATIAQLGFVAGVALVRALESVSDFHAHAEVTGAAGPRSMRDGIASFEARLRRAPQDEEVGGPRAVSGMGEATFTLKWPNDVLADGRKLSGILLQTETLPSGRRAVVVGIGVNVRHAAEGLAYPTTSLHALGVDLQAEDLLEALSAAWIEVAALWDEGRGFAAVRAAWLARAAGLAGTVSVRLRDDVLEGSFETIDEFGQLVLRTDDGTLRHVSAGEVHFGSAATARPEATV